MDCRRSYLTRALALVKSKCPPYAGGQSKVQQLVISHEIDTTSSYGEWVHDGRGGASSQCEEGDDLEEADRYARRALCHRNRRDDRLPRNAHANGIMRLKALHAASRCALTPTYRGCRVGVCSTDMHHNSM